MTKAILLLTVLAAIGTCQTTVYLRDNPQGFQIAAPGCTNATPTVCTVTSTSGLSAGQKVVISRVAVNNPGANNISAANGLRKIGAVDNTAHTISLLDPDTGTPIAGNGAWSDGVGNYAYPGVQMGGVVTPYPLVSGIKGYFDGDSGPFTRQHAQTWLTGLATTNGVQVTGCPAACVVTVNMSTPLNPVMVAGQRFTVWGTTVTAFNQDGVNTDLTVAASPVPTGTSYSSTPFTAPTGLTNGDYTHNNDHCGPGVTPNETIQGTEPCVVVSAWAVTTNLPWARLKYTADSLPLSFQKFYVDGGQNVGEQGMVLAETSALVFQVDRRNHGVGSSGNTYLDSVLYFLNNLEKAFGANFLINERFSDGGNASNSYGHDNTPQTIATLWGFGQAFLTSTHRAAAIGKLLNDIQDAAPCTKNLAVPHDTLATGTVAAAGATSITLSSSDSAPDGFYVNNMIVVRDATGYYEADLLVSNYTASTKKATGTLSGFTPAAGLTYNIYSTVTISNTTAGGVATITGYNTNFSDVGVGDMLYGINPKDWGNGFNVSGNGPWVTASSVISAPSGSPGTTQTITNLINASTSQISTTVPTVYWRSAKWTTGNCGWVWMAKHFDGNAGNTQPASYGLNGGASVNLGGPSSNNLLGHNVPIMDMMLSLADFDPRAALQASQYQLVLQDLAFGIQWNYMTGFTGSGVGYGLDVTSKFANFGPWLLSKNVVGYPDAGMNGPFTLGLTTWKTYAFLPDNPLWTPNGAVNTPMIYGGGQSNNLGTLAPGYDMMNDFGQAANPSAPASQYLKSLLNEQGYNTFDAVGSTYVPEIYAKIDPRIVPVDHKVQPLQQFFGPTAIAQCSSLTQWGPCNPAIAATAVLSRGWGGSATLSNAWTDRTGSLLQYQARTFLGDHDGPQPGTLVIWDVGCLRCSDEVPSGDSGGLPPDIGDSTPELTGATSMCPGTSGPTGSQCPSGGGKTNGVAIASIDGWAGADHGTWPATYGDTNSKYVYAHSNLTGAYTTAYNHVVQHWAHFKKPGADEISILYHDIDSSNHPTQVAVHAPFPQNGETIAGLSLYYLSYDEGTTSCPGTGGCANLNAKRAVLEQENGATNSHGNPTANKNLIWNLVVPTGAPNVWVNWDCPGGGQCSPGSTYPGGLGHANRVSICADSGNTGACGAGAQNGLEAIEVMKLATQPDTALTTTAINPDANWSGAQVNNAVVALFARHGTTYGTIADFVTTHAGTAQYLIAGLTPGIYPVTVNGVAVTGSPFTVTGGTAGGNALEFESASGTVHINGSAPTCQISTASLPGGTIGTPYSQTIATFNCTPNPPTSNWTVATGSLCPGLTLNASTGTISGVPTGTATTCTFTIRVVDTVPTTATSGSLSITMSTGGTVMPGAMTSGGSLSSGSRR